MPPFLYYIIKKRILQVVLKIFYYNDYHINSDDLDYYEQFTYAKPKVKVKK